MNVLLISNNKNFIAAVETNFNQHSELDIVLISADKATDAYQILVSMRFDAVMTDIGLGNCYNGIDIAKEIKYLRPNVPIIMMTSSQDFMLKTKAIEYGDRLWIKNGNVDGLCDILQSVLHKTEETISCG